MAQKRLARGLRLNQTEAIALIASVLQERIRDGVYSVADLMQHGKALLGRRHVLPGVSALIHEIQVEGTFVDGWVVCRLNALRLLILFNRVFLVTVHEPICTEHGDIHAALYGSFLPVPSAEVFPAVDWSHYAIDKAPGYVKVRPERIVLNKGRERVELKVTNNGDRPIQVSALVRQ